jgi:hypothetical protein
MRDLPDDDYFIDGNGLLTERVMLGGQEVVVHYDDVPAEDLTVLRGIRVTTALRTVIDLAPDCEPGELERMVADCLRRRLFTVAEARTRIAKPDMQTRRGAVLLRELLR